MNEVTTNQEVSCRICSAMGNVTWECKSHSDETIDSAILELAKAHQLLQMSTESNERWATQDRALKASIETNLEAMLSQDSELINDPYFKALAELVDFSLDAEFDVTITLKYSVTVTAPRGTKASEVESAIEWSNPRFSLESSSEWELSGGYSDWDDYSIDAELQN